MKKIYLKVKRRSKNLDSELIERIVNILDGWKGSLTWELYAEAIFKHLRQSYTRQTLNKHERIKEAFSLRKADLSLVAKVNPKRVSDPALQAALDRIERIVEENTRLKRENNNLLEQFVRWAYNANLNGLSLNILNEALDKPNRRQTEKNEVKLVSTAAIPRKIERNAHNAKKSRVVGQVLFGDVPF